MTAPLKVFFLGRRLRVIPRRQAASIGPANPRAQPTPAAPAPLAAERDQLVVAAVAAAQAQEAMGQDAAFKEGVELVFDEQRQVGPSSVLRRRG